MSIIRKINNLTREVNILKAKLCKGSSLFYPTLADFPATGSDNILYVDESTGGIYIWENGEYIRGEGIGELVNYNEDLICLNTALPVFTPLDVNNPITAEVQAWVTSNLSVQQRKNGTQIVYYVVGSGGSCADPDFIWTLNSDFEVTLSDKRVFNAKTVYVDSISGSDITGKRGYREYPFKTLDAAIAVTQTGDLLKVFPGDYAQTVTIENLINIDCDNGVDWTFTGNFFNNTPDWATDVTTTWTFDVLRSTLTAPANNQHNFGIKNTLGIFVLNANKLEYVYHAANVAIKERYINVKKLVNSYMIASSLSPVVDAVSKIELDYYERTATNNEALLIGAQMGNNAKLTTYIKNLKSINSLTGYGSSPTIGYYFGSDAGTNKQYTTIIDNVTHDDPNIYTTPPGPLDKMEVWRQTGVGSTQGLLLYLSATTNNSIYNVEFKNIKSSGFGVTLLTTSLRDNVTIFIKIKGYFEKGIPINTNTLISFQNSKIIFDLDVECSTSMGVYLNSGGTSGIHPTTQLIITGRIKSKHVDMPCISIGTGSDNDTNGSVLLKDLTLINAGLVSPIVSGNLQNIQIQNVVTNSLVADPNITEVGQSIIRDVNYK